MKKFSKVLTGVLSALLLTVGGVNFTSCSNDDGDTPKNPSLTIAAEASEGQVTAGGVITTTITATLKDTTFKGPIAKDASLNAYVDITYSGDTDFVGDPTLTAVEAIANGATVAKVKLVQTAAAVTEEKSGTISVKIKASALASGKDLTAGNKLPYKISAATPTPAPTPAPAASELNYSFANITGVTLSDTDSSGKDDNIAAEQTLNSSDTIKVVLLAASNEAFGSDEIAAGSEYGGVTLTQKYKLKNIPTYKTNNAATGLTMKNTCVKVTGATGNVNVEIVWSIAGKKAANDRGMFVKIGTTIAGLGNSDTSASETPTSTKHTLKASGDLGTGGDIFIAASNECIIESIKVTPVTTN